MNLFKYIFLLLYFSKALCFDSSIISLIKNVQEKLKPAATHWITSNLSLGFISNLVSLQRQLTNPSSIINYSKQNHFYKKYMEPRLGLNILMESDIKFIQQIDTVTLRFFNWLLLSNENQFDSYIEDLYIPADSRVLLAWKKNDYWIVQETWNVMKHLPKQNKSWAYWPLNVNYHFLKPPQSIAMRQNLLGITLRGITFHEYPVMVQGFAKKNVSKAEGKIAEIANVLSYYLNSKLDIHFNNSLKWGVLLKGKWNGLIAELLADRADIGLANFMITSGRANAVDFLFSFTTTKVYTYIQKMDSIREEEKLTKLFKVFSFELWLTLLISIILFSLFLYIIEGKKINLSTNILYIIRIFSFQGIPKIPSRTSYQIVIIFCFILAIVLQASFSANLVANLSSRKLNLPFTNLEGLVNNRKYNFTTMANSAYYNMIYDNRKDKIFGILYKEHLLPQFRTLKDSTYKALKSICDRPEKKIATLVRYDNAQLVIPRLNCPLVHLPEIFAFAHISLAVSKNFPFRSIINYKLNQLREAGILKRNDHLYLDSYRKYLNKLKEKEKQFIRLHLIDICPLFLILSIGLLLSLINFLLEKSLYKYFTYKLRTLIKK